MYKKIATALSITGLVVTLATVVDLYVVEVVLPYELAVLGGVLSTAGILIAPRSHKTSVVASYVVSIIMLVHALQIYIAHRVITLWPELLVIGAAFFVFGIITAYMALRKWR